LRTRPATVITAGIGKVTRSRNGCTRGPTSHRVSASPTPASPQAPCVATPSSQHVPAP